MSSSSSLFSSRDFRLLLAGQTTSQLGTQVSGVALPLLAVVALSASPFEVGLLGAASTIAFAVLALPAGAWLDRLHRRPVLIAADVVRALALLTIPLAWWLGMLMIAQLLVVAFVVGVGRVFFDVGYQSYLPTVIGRNRVLAGNAAMEFARTGGQIVGPGLGGILVSLLGAALVLLVQAVTFAVSAVTLAAIRTREEPVDQHAHAAPAWRRVAEGVRFVVAHPVLRATAVASAASNLSFAIASAVTIVFLARELRVPEWGVGILLALAGVGAMVASALAPRLARRVGSARIVWMALAVTGPLTLLVPLGTPGWGLAFVLVGMFAGELGQIVYAISNVSLRQRICPDRILARVNATMGFAVMGLFPVGAVIGGVLGETIGVRGTLVVAGLVVLVAPVTLFAALRRHRDVEELAPDSAG